ncbi:MAG TPA: family 78 glycoside hydrolase catalytic domain [Verrucomicrobiae bacterium]|nr:family 78 glycoside hydrolase catalytic domain [Verrucomicrobiae bacterium]
MKPLLHRALYPVSLLLATIFSSVAAMTAGDLRCEHLENPQGIDAAQPRLSWMLQSNERGVKQTAYQILVASSAAKLKSGQGDLWDSGKVSSDESVLVHYAGKPLASRTECFWKVRVWGTDGKPGKWSQPAKWTMGILDPGEWHAQWIGQDGIDLTNEFTGTSWIWYPEGEPQVTAPIETNYFRRVVTIPAGRRIKRAIFEYTGDNECRGWIDQFDVGARNNFKTVKWNNITTRLEPGKTYLFGLTGRNEGTEPNPAGVVGKLTIEFTEGEPLIIPTDEKWKVSKNPEPGWNTVSFDDSKWVAAKVLGPAGMKPWDETRVPENRRQPARYLRKDFAVEKKIARATVSFSGLGLSELYLNGKKIGDAVLSPAFAQYDKREFYVTYDVTKDLQRGANALGVILGNGRFYADRSKVYAGTVSFGWPKLLLNLRIEYADGSTAEIVSDASWQLTTDGPILANNDFDGEEYDAQRELNGWSEPGYSLAASPSPLPGERAGVRGESASATSNASGEPPAQAHPSPLIPLPSEGRGKPQWTNAQIVSAPGGILSAQMIEPIRVTETLKPVSMKEINPGVFIYDLGQNMVGWCRLHVSGPAGAQVRLRHAETLKPDGSLYMANLRGAEVTDIYTLKGGGNETWEPKFITHGFRFVEVTGYPGKPDLNSIEGCVVNDDLPVAGSFSCSNELINRIYTNIVWGTRGNYRSLPTDCPQRDERQGWLGDRSEECKGEAYLFNIAALYTKWRQDMGDAQRTNGVIPDVAPAYWPIYSDNVTWPSSAIIIPSALERQFGDTLCVSRDYDSAKLWMDHMLTLATNNILSKDSYGDWCVPPEEASLIHSKDPARQTDKALLATSYFYYDLCLMEKYAKQLGKTEDAARWGKLAEDFAAAFNAKFLDREKGQYSNGTQTSCVLPLAFGLVPEDMKEKIFAHLVDKIENDTHGHIGTGLIGGQYLNRVLSDNGRADLCYTIASQKDYPSWGYMVEQGATTIWELWNGNTAEPSMNSGNHVMLIGDLVVWFYEYLAGIAPGSPGFKTIVMKPTPVGDLTFVKATHNSPYGLIASEWHKDGKKFDWQIEIPANTKATVYLPGSSIDKITENGKPFSAGWQGVELWRQRRTNHQFIIMTVDSGKYHFISE